MEKLTKAMVFEIIADYFDNVGIDTIVSLATQNSCSASEIVDFCNHERELLAKKKSRGSKPTANQLANEVIKNKIIELLTVKDTPLSTTEIMNVLAAEYDTIISNQKCAALLTQLSKVEQRIDRTVVKKTAYFSIV